MSLVTEECPEECGEEGQPHLTCEATGCQNEVCMGNGGTDNEVRYCAACTDKHEREGLLNAFGTTDPEKIRRMVGGAVREWKDHLEETGADQRDLPFTEFVKGGR